MESVGATAPAAPDWRLLLPFVSLLPYPRPPTSISVTDCRFLLASTSLRHPGSHPARPVAGGPSTGVGATALFVVALLFAGVVLHPVGAQTSPTPPPPPRQADSSDTKVKSFQLADAYMRSGQYEKAIPLLEDLHAEEPNNHTFYTKLKTAYENVKQYDDAISLVEERMENGRPSPMRMSEKARLLYLKGEEDRAFEVWEEAWMLAPEQSSTYRMVYQALVDIRRFDKAVEILQTGREQLGDPSAFRIEIAYLYNLDGEHRKAMEEYAALLKQNPERSDFVRTRLSSFIDQGEGLEASIDVLKQAVREEPLNRGYRELLAWLHMEEEAYGKALDVYRAIDRLEEENGRVLFSFAQKAADAEAYDAASRAYDLILERHPDSPAAPAAQKGLGDMHRRWARELDEQAVDGSGDRIDAPHYEAARTAYQTFLDTYPNHQALPDVLRQLGHLHQEVFRDLDAATNRLREVVNRYPETDAANEARYDLGRIALLRGNLSEARLAFSRLVERVRTGDLAEKARYELALLHFYQGEFDAALTRVEATNQNTSADVANDAIELKVLLRQNRGPDSLHTPLRLYAEARLQERRHRYDQSLATLDTLLSRFGRHSLADNARYLKARTFRAAGDTTQAAEQFAQVPLMHPRSPFADRSLYERAELLEAQNDLEGAVQTYNKLLEDYPKSLLVPDARTRMRDLWSRQG